MAQEQPFRFGVLAGNAASGAAWQAMAQQAEALGYASFMVYDHLGDQLAPIPALMAAATATTRLRVGSLVFANDFRHPALLAREAATVDLLSGGRFELGIGAGWLRTEYEQAGIPFDPPAVRVSRMEEAVRVIKGLFSGEPLTFEGQHYHLNALPGLPRPQQQPHPPLLIGGARQRLLTFAAQEADIVGFAANIRADGSPDLADSLGAALDRKVSWVRQAAAGRFAQLELNVNVGGVVITDDREQTAAQLAPTVGLDGPQLLECVHALIGTTEQIIADLLLRRKRYGISYVVIPVQDMEAFAPVVAKLKGE